MSQSPESITSKDASVYYQGKYWNDLPLVQELLNFKISQQPQLDWMEMLAKRYQHQPFRRGLFINCGNGWVERKFIDLGIVQQAEGFDFSDELIHQAKQAKGLLPITYYQADANTIELKENHYDLIVNSAALHHVQYLDRLCRQLFKAITSDGLFVHYEYVGPSRNQYSKRHWQLVKRWNQILPSYLQHPNLRYAHVPTMLREDPSEAIHSDLIIPTLSRYFWINRQVELGGGLAYPLFTHNERIFQLEEGEWESWQRLVLAEDQKLTLQGVVPNLFWYAETTPKPILPSTTDLNFWQEEENAREVEASRWGGVYDWSGLVELWWDMMKTQCKKFLKLLLRK